jgi:hypothetical protein
MMLWTMPLMFGLLSLTLPSGLALYWTTSNILTIVIQYFVTGWGGLAGLIARRQPGRGKLAAGRLSITDRLTAWKPSIIDKLLALRPSAIRDRKYKERIAQVEELPSAGADIVESGAEQEEELAPEEVKGKQRERGGGYPKRFEAIRRQPRRGKGHRRKRR